MTTSVRPRGNYGRRPPKRAPAIQFSAIMNARPVEAPPPAAVDYISPMGGGWKMLGNGPDNTVAPGFAGCGDCIAPHVRVLTADLRWVQAGKLQVGDRLTAFEEFNQPGRNGRCYRTSIVEQADRETRPCYDLEFSDGTRVRCSAGHRWLVGPSAETRGDLSRGGAAQWVETRHLKLGPLQASNVVKPLDAWGTDYSREAGYLAAAFNGEGNLEQKLGQQRVSFAQVDNVMLTETERYLKELGFEYQHGIQPRGGNSCADGSTRQDIHRLTVGRRTQFLRLLGSIRPERLLEKFQPDLLGRLLGQTVRLVKKEFVGEQEIIVLNTSSRTYIAEGLASHNCVAVHWSNSRRVISKVIGGHEVYPPWAQVLKIYQTQNPDFDPTGDPDTTGPGSPADGGMDIQTFLEFLVANPGFGDGGVLVGFAAVDYTNTAEVDAAIAAGGVLSLGINVQEAQQTQFSDDQPWNYVAGSPVEGGHCVVCGGYGTSPAGSDPEMAGQYKDVTWAEESSLTTTFWGKEVEEMWFLIWKEQLGTTEFQAGVNLAAFASEYTAITGKPFPVAITPPPAPAPPTPAPTPTPTPPTPTPTPPVPPVPPVSDPADSALAAAVTHWAGERHVGKNEQVAQALETWLAAKGFTAPES
jgi:hypothetical protein